MDAKEVHMACVAAVESCPQCDYDDDHNDVYCEDTDDLYWGEKPLYQRGMIDVIQYWKDPKTIGGHLLWDMGYWHRLPEEVAELFDNIDRIIKKAIKDHFKNP